MPNPFLGLGFNSWSTKYSRGSAGGGGGDPSFDGFLQYTTTELSDGDTITLRNSGFGSRDYDINWGDGTTENFTTTGTKTHTYTTGGVYNIQVTLNPGNAEYRISNLSTGEDKIAAVAGQGGSALGLYGMQIAFRSYFNMTFMTPDFDVSGVKRFSDAWYECRALASFPALDFSNVDFIDNTWRDCRALTSFPAIDLSTATKASGAWNNCLSLTSFPALDLGNVSNSTGFNSTWANCSSLTTFPAVTMTKGVSFYGTWENCTSLTTFPANMFDTTGTLYSSAFTDSFSNCALSAQSIENILTSLDTNGQTGVTLGIDGGTNAAKTTWSAAANTAYTNLIGKSWTINYNA